jgi:hypothetical protein
MAGRAPLRSRHQFSDSAVTIALLLVLVGSLAMMALIVKRLEKAS